MQPVRNRWRRTSSRRRRLRLIGLGLLLTLAAALIFFGRHPRYWAPSPRQSDPFPASVGGAGRVIDGDSLWVGGNEVRLKGIDAPEWKQTCQRDGKTWNCGEAATSELARAIGSESITCKVSERDVYGRLLAYCAAGARDLNASMVLSGMAVAFGGYWNEQSKAKSERRGIWAGEFQEPRNWRSEHASEEAR